MILSVLRTLGIGSYGVADQEDEDLYEVPIDGEIFAQLCSQWKVVIKIRSCNSVIMPAHSHTSQLDSTRTAPQQV